MTVKQKSDGSWPDADEWPTIKAAVTCRTQGCPVERIAFTVTLYENVEPPTYRAQCARCNVDITDIVEVN